MRKTLTLLTAAGALGVAVAGCGQSKVPGIVPAPSGGAVSQAAAATTTTPTTTTPTTPTTPTTTVKTPTSGPLSQEPKITAGKGSPPKTLQTKDLVKGTGATVQAGDTVTVNYVGATYPNGKVFDASWKRHQPYTTPLSSVIPGWQKGMIGMKVGGRRELIIPPSLGYKNQAQPGIPAGSTLIFIVDLLKVSKG